MKATVYKCDGCGREKQQANHWFVAHEAVNGDLVFGMWVEPVDDLTQHYCGTDCLTRRLAQWAE